MSDTLHNLLFLDIDGVLTSYSSGTSYLCENPENYHVDQDCLSNLIRIAAGVPGLKVVVHSAWVNRMNDEHPSFEYRGKIYESPLPEVSEWLREYDLLLGYTAVGRLDKNGNKITKKTKIINWLDGHRGLLGPGSKALVLDDDVSFNDLPSINSITFSNNIVDDLKFLPINHTMGLTKEDAARAIEYFKG